MLSQHVVAANMHIGCITPVLKKPTLDSNLPKNYRPIIVSTNDLELMELCQISFAECGKMQFRFRNGLGIDMICSFLHDLIQYFNSKGYPVFACGSDAKKCSDRVWHNGLFYKLRGRIDFIYCLKLYEWCNKMNGIARWNGTDNDRFRVT